MTTIAIVDDHLLLVETMQAALRGRDLQTMVFAPGPQSDLQQALLAAAPDLVLLDLDLGPFGDSTVLIRPLVSAGIRVLIVTGIADRLRVALTLEQGAIGFQPKAAGFDALVQAATRALAATGPLDPEQRTALLHDLAESRARDAHATAPFRSLTDRERETLRALSNGLTVRQIADGWVVSEATVRSHVQRVLIKLGAASQVQAVVMALRGGWFPSPAGGAAG